MRNKIKIILELSPSEDGELKLIQHFKLTNKRCDENFENAYKVFYKELFKKLQSILDKSAQTYKKSN